jgi:two-component system cell cycle response regulator DivK
MAGERVLIVDDNPINLKLARLILDGEGYLIETAGGAEEALAVLESFAPALILMDVQLPGMDGLSLVRKLRDDVRFSQTFIIAFTAYAMKGDEEKSLAAGCDDYVTKPIHPDALLEIVAGFLGKTR